MLSTCADIEGSQFRSRTGLEGDGESNLDQAVDSHDGHVLVGKCNHAVEWGRRRLGRLRLGGGVDLLWAQS